MYHVRVNIADARYEEKDHFFLTNFLSDNENWLSLQVTKENIFVNQF